MNDQGRDVKTLKVFGEVCLGERLDAVVGALVAGLHRHHPKRVSDALRHGGTFAVRAVERGAQVLVKLRPVARDTVSDLVEYLDWQAAGIPIRPQAQRRGAGDEAGFCEAGRGTPGDVTRY